MTIELAPITDADIAEVADFLHANYKKEIPWARSRLAEPWKVDAPNHGFILRDGRRIVGAHLAFYSERLVAGRLERFCDLGTWYVLPEFRFHSLSILKALLEQDGYQFITLSPADNTVSIITWLGFRHLDASACLIPHLPWPTPPSRTTISADPDVIGSTLTGTELQRYRDHAEALAAHHMVLIRGRDSCYVVYRKTRAKGMPIAVIAHASNPALFRRAVIPLTRHLLVRHRLLATLADLRIIGRRPPLSFSVTSWPKMYLSDSLEPELIDDLYSESLCIPW